VIGPGQTVAREQRITLCRQVSQDCGSDDERHLGSQAGESSTFGSADYEPAHYGEQPSVAHVSDAAAAAAGNSLPSTCWDPDPFLPDSTVKHLVDHFLMPNPSLATMIVPPPWPLLLVLEAPLPAPTSKLQEMPWQRRNPGPVKLRSNEPSHVTPPGGSSCCLPC